MTTHDTTRTLTDTKIALLIVDVQHDFLPGGALGVPGGDEILDAIVARAAEADIGLIVASADRHPAGHCSFIARGGIWPEHCVTGTRGADLHPRIAAITDLLVEKATTEDVDAYSAFDATGLADQLREKGITRLMICGLATDYCVKATVLDALTEGFDVEIDPTLMRGVEITAGDTAKAIEEMTDAGARMRVTATTGGRA